MKKLVALVLQPLILGLILAVPSSSCGQQQQRPNLLLIMADDLGIEGLGCYGGVSYRTPNLDKLAAEGVRFDRAFSQPLCTPTRVQIMTGKYNHRNWKYFGILDPTEKTFAHLLKDAGYATGIFGKWQLQSYDPPGLPGSAKRRGTGMHPKDAGFDEYALFHALHTEDKGSRYANPTMLEGSAANDGRLQTYSGRYGEDVWVEKIVDFFDRHRGEPTFVYYPMALPHWPFEPTPKSDAWNPDQVPEANVRFASEMIEYMDTAVGNLLGELEQRGLREQTLVLFYSDNGTDTRVTSKLADGRTIRGGKATPQQTGIHVPLIANWPKRISPAVCSDLVDASDFLPTLVELSGASLPEGHLTDGNSFAPALWGASDRVAREAAFFWYDPRPGWDKERFNRHVFALNRTHKLFRSGRLFRLTDRPLEEIEVDPLAMNVEDRKAQLALRAVIEKAMKSVREPPLVNAYGEEQHDLLSLPKDREETDRINDQLLATADEFVYGDDDVAEHRLWIFSPLQDSGDELRPCVFLVHGGGWGGSPRLLAAQATYLQRRGYVTVVIHFRPPSKSKSKDGSEVTPIDTLRDVKRAYRWVVANGAQHQIDVSKIVVAGGSAGGHLSLAMSTIAVEGDSTVEPAPAGYLLFNPVIDLVEGWSSGRKRCEQFGIDPRAFSPAHQVRAGLPPTLVLSGSEDTLISPDLIRGFVKRMRSAGNSCDFVEYPGAGHGFFNYGREGNRYFQWTMWEFEKFLSGLYGKGRG